MLPNKFKMIINSSLCSFQLILIKCTSEYLFPHLLVDVECVIDEGLPFWGAFLANTPQFQPILERLSAIFVFIQT